MVEILFLCSANKDRSIMAQEYFSSNEETGHHTYASAGLNELEVGRANRWRENNFPDDSHISRHAKEDLLRGHELIFVMEDKHREWIHKYFQENFPDEVDEIINKVVVLDIKNNYSKYKKDQKQSFCNLIDHKLSWFLRNKTFNLKLTGIKK